MRVPPLATVAACEMVTEFAATAEMYARTVELAAAIEFVGAKVQFDEEVAPVTVATSDVAVVMVSVPRTTA